MSVYIFSDFVSLFSSLVPKCSSQLLRDSAASTSSYYNCLVTLYLNYGIHEVAWVFPLLFSSKAILFSYSSSLFPSDISTVFIDLSVHPGFLSPPWTWKVNCQGLHICFLFLLFPMSSLPSSWNVCMCNKTRKQRHFYLKLEKFERKNSVIAYTLNAPSEPGNLRPIFCHCVAS